MNLIIVISILAGLVMYLEADHQKLNSWKWGIATFLICYTSYYLYNFIAGFFVYGFGFWRFRPLNGFIGLMGYVLPLFLLRPISKKMKDESKTKIS